MTHGPRRRVCRPRADTRRRKPPAPPTHAAYYRAALARVTRGAAGARLSHTRPACGAHHRRRTYLHAHAYHRDLFRVRLRGYGLQRGRARRHVRDAYTLLRAPAANRTDDAVALRAVALRAGAGTMCNASAAAGLTCDAAAPEAACGAASLRSSDGPPSLTSVTMPTSPATDRISRVGRAARVGREQRGRPSKKPVRRSRTQCARTRSRPRPPARPRPTRRCAGRASTSHATDRISRVGRDAGAGRERRARAPKKPVRRRRARRAVHGVARDPPRAAGRHGDEQGVRRRAPRRAA